MTRSTEKETSDCQMVGKYPAYNKCTIISTAIAKRNKKNLMFYRVFTRTNLNRVSDSRISSYLVRHKGQTYESCFEITVNVAGFYSFARKFDCGRFNC
jgi:hypothetical protein